ncbi:MAG: GntR family transcriptional regulator [Peptoniphilaceae bacterium]
MKLRDKVRLKLIDEINIAKNTESRKLENEKDLATKLGVSRVTLRNALADLELEGKIIRLQGRGTFVHPNILNMEIDLNRMPTYDQLIKQMGYKLKVDTLFSKVIDTPEDILKSGAFKDPKIFKTSRMFFANDIFCTLCIDYLDIKFKNESNEINKYPNSIFKYLYEKHGIKVKTDSVKWSVASPSEVENIIKPYKTPMPHKGLLLASSVVYDDKLSPILFTREYINTEIVKFKTVRYRDIDYSNYKNPEK